MIEILHPVRDRIRIEELCVRLRFVDGWESAAADLRELRRFDSVLPDVDVDGYDHHSRYVVFPWRATMVRLPDEVLFHRLRTSRNRYLITETEQLRWESATIAVAGLSVGASLLHTCVLTGARRLRIADPDTLGPTNLNRLTGSVCDLGTPKAELAMRRTLETDPYINLEVFAEGVTEETASAFFGGNGDRTPDIVLEEVDDLATKVAIRRWAREAGLPVVMVTDDGDNVIVDVERYDLEPGRPLFHGNAGDIEALDADELRDPANRVRIAGAIVGEAIGPRTREALREVGRTMPSWPQLGTAATLAGAVGAVTARRIVCGDELPSGRARLSIDEVLVAVASDRETCVKRAEHGQANGCNTSS
ncbi:MAG: ThiF family adenylyltransferase [Gordonia polyisoprenivorans]|nr:ThiF family adenylyltransferase [Gordonia polyisoprenivorans]